MPNYRLKQFEIAQVSNTNRENQIIRISNEGFILEQIGNIINKNANNSTDDLIGLLHSYEFFQISSLRKPEMEFSCHLFWMFWSIAVSHALQT